MVSPPAGPLDDSSPSSGTSSSVTAGRTGFDLDHSLGTPEVDELLDAWRRGERPTALDVLARHPELGHEAAIRLVYEEYCLRLEAGMKVDPAEFAGQFPEWRDELEVLFDCHRLMETEPAGDRLPAVGQVVAGFHLLAELGRGVSGQVYLAAQADLADRPVVLKITPRGREEHLSLARLQHMSIVPLYSEQVLRGSNLQVLCMPYLGGASLAQVLGALKERHPERRTGRDLLEALDAIQRRLPVSLPPAGPYRRHLARSSYVETLCWTGACLADGLQYAHDRDLVHMDIKPSNVLIAGDGQPMLLDFHLARPPIVPGEPPPAWMGGTPEYMAPEQRRAVAAVRGGRPIDVGVDGRADIYSLGRLLHEALGGPRPGADDETIPRLDEYNPRVSVGLADVIHRCLRADPAERYPDAASLAADLRRHLSDLPLRGVPNRSLAERWHKWRRRRPYALSRIAIVIVAAATITAAAALVGAGYRQRVHEVEAALADSRLLLDRHEYARAGTAARRGLELAGSMPGVGSMRDALDEELARSIRAARAAELHRLAELVRFRYGIDPPPREEAESLIRSGRAIWAARGSLLARIGARRDEAAEREIRSDLLDVLLVWANLRVRMAPPAEAAEARREATALLAEAATLLGPSSALDLDRLAYAVPGDGDAPDAPPPPRTEREHDNLGRSYLRSGKVAEASEQFERGLELRPQDFWLNFYEGQCAYRLGRYADAVSAFRVCIALSPTTPECFHNRALALSALGQSERAIRDYNRALALDPGLTAAALNRGLLHYGAGRLPEAAADLNRALATTSERSVVGVIRYNLALVDLARGDRGAALANLKQAEELGHEAARTLRGRLQP